MEKRRFTLVSNEPVATKTWRACLASDDPSFVAGGEFVQVALDGFYLRHPLSICERSEGRIVLIYKVVGDGTAALSASVPVARTTSAGGISPAVR